MPAIPPRLDDLESDLVPPKEEIDSLDCDGRRETGPYAFLLKDA